MNTATNIATGHTVNPPEDVVSDRPDAQPGPLVSVSADTVYGAIDTLLRFDAFFRHHRSNHGDTVHAQLRTFCAGLGWHPTSGAEALLDQLGLYAWSLQRALQTAETAGTTDVDSPTSKETA